MKLRSNKYEAYSLKELYEARKNIDRQKYPKHYKDIVMQIGKKMTESQNFECVKCKSHRYDLGELYAPGDWFSKIFIIDSDKYVTITCKNCKYVEMYKGSVGELSNILDFLVN
ncbi:zinc ribbon domain-containing protein [Bermanella sp. WJH001]|uniref:zinc ribbon domain-containing protein n=1 Tax=Bermanella sp. WJH001 TaxID=3048005 RepID=UPI0024BECC4F|nr:zinc ribbon domain-containing protein [Bermanella sp. WJH001]MDJ1539301.1 zinc ribbon domain-containing protein [Bermanella sp. WJH001]